MSEESFLSDDFLRQLISVGDVDLLVGIPSHNDGNTISKVVRAIEEGVLRDFPRERVVLVNVDGGSRDATSKMIIKAASSGYGKGIESLRTLRWISTSSGDAASPGNMIRTILAAADLLHARGCAIVSAGAENATAEWVKGLLTPVYRENFDFVAPLYARHKFDGLLTRNLLYPLGRAIYGKPIRELRSSQFAFSGRLAAYCLSEGEWHNEAIQGGAEMWMAITAMAHGYRCCQTYLGPKKRASSSAGVVETIRRTVGGIFWCLESTEAFWLKGAGQEHVRTNGADHQLTTEAIRVDRKKLLEMYRNGVPQLAKILEQILDAETHAELLRLAALDESAFHLSNSLWAQVIYEFAAAYHHSVLNRDHLVQAIVPIYRGRVYSFLTQHRTSNSEALESDLEDLCREFASRKPFFIERWKTKGQGAS